jgi:hypothetical protein
MERPTRQTPTLTNNPAMPPQTRSGRNRVASSVLSIREGGGEDPRYLLGLDAPPQFTDLDVIDERG